MNQHNLSAANAKWPNWALALNFAVLLACLSTGCAHIGPGKIVEKRLPYQEAVAESWKEQVLLNIVKIRYADTISFTNVSQIVDSHAVRRTGGVDVALIPGLVPGLTAFDQLRTRLRGSAERSERPTITYAPQTGSAFLQQLARPLPPKSVLFFIESGFPAEVVLPLTVESINGVRNRSSSGTAFRPADPEFDWIVQVFNRAQQSRSVSMRVEVDKDSQQTTLLRLRPPTATPDPELDDDLVHARRLLNLDPNREEYLVVPGSVQVDGNELVMQTRPLLRILASLSQYVDVPQKHLCDGSVTPIDSIDWSRAMLHVHCGDEPPECCFASTCYRGCWFWVEDCDLNSKRTFSYLLLLLAQADREDKAPLPLVTIPVDN